MAYFASAGIIALPAALADRKISTPYFFYRSSTGARLLPALVVENLAGVIEGGYDWRLLGGVYMLIAGVTAALLALLAYRLAFRLGAPPLYAFCLGAGVLAVHFTFPDVLASYWELSAQGLAMPL